MPLYSQVINSAMQRNTIRTIVTTKRRLLNTADAFTASDVRPSCERIRNGDQKPSISSHCFEINMTEDGEFKLLH